MSGRRVIPEVAGKAAAASVKYRENNESFEHLGLAGFGVCSQVEAQDYGES